MTNQNQKSDPMAVRDMAGYIARNDKRTNDRQPQWRGKVTIKGKMYYLSLWEKSGDIMSMAVTDPDERPMPGQGNQGGAAQSQGGNYPSQQANPPVGGDPFGDIFTG